MRLVKPRLSKYIEDKNLVVEDCYSGISDYLIKGQEIDFKICDVEINGCKFVDVDFFMLSGVELIDCWFENCDLSNANFSFKSIHRCYFDNCKLVGCDFSGCGVRDVWLENCKGNYINFSFSDIKNVIIRDSCLVEGGFVGTKFKKVEFDKCDMRGCEFVNTSLADIDLSSCEISRISCDISGVKGVILNTEQALMMVSMLGIVIK